METTFVIMLLSLCSVLLFLLFRAYYLRKRLLVEGIQNNYMLNFEESTLSNPGEQIPLEDDIHSELSKMDRESLELEFLEIKTQLNEKEKLLGIQQKSLEELSEILKKKEEDVLDHNAVLSMDKKLNEILSIVKENELSVDEREKFKTELEEKTALLLDKETLINQLTPQQYANQASEDGLLPDNLIQTTGHQANSFHTLAQLISDYEAEIARLSYENNALKSTYSTLLDTENAEFKLPQIKDELLSSLSLKKESTLEQLSVALDSISKTSSRQEDNEAPDSETPSSLSPDLIEMPIDENTGDLANWKNELDSSIEQLIDFEETNLQEDEFSLPQSQVNIEKNEESQLEKQEVHQLLEQTALEGELGKEEEYIDQKEEDFTITAEEYLAPSFDVLEDLVGLGEHDANPLAEEEIINHMSKKANRLLDELDGMSISDDEGLFLVYNKQLSMMTGFTLDEANRYSQSGQFLSLLYPDPEYRSKVLNEISNIPQGSFSKVYTSLRTKSGMQRPYWVSSTYEIIDGKKYYLSIYHETNL